MKTFAVILLCAFVAVQGRSAVVKSTRSEVALGENPWVVHLRTAVSTSGLLNSCVGSLIDNQWVLTTATCLDDIRFIWVRYGFVDVISPELVTENSAVRLNPSANLGLIAINRNVETTDNIAPISLATSTSEVPSTGSVSVLGKNSEGGPGERLLRYDVTLEVRDDGLIAGQIADGETTEFDIGAPLVADGVQIGVLVGAADDESSGKFVSIAEHLDWIESETGLSFRSKANNDAVHFIN